VNDIVDRLRGFLSGPHKSGRKWTIVHDADPTVILEAIDEIERLRDIITNAREAVGYGHGRALVGEILSAAFKDK